MRLCVASPLISPRLPDTARGKDDSDNDITHFPLTINHSYPNQLFKHHQKIYHHQIHKIKGEKKLKPLKVCILKNQQSFKEEEDISFKESTD